MENKVYLVWYKRNSNERVGLWGVYGSQVAAEKAVDEIENDFHYTATYTEENVLE